jgi:hypothetical protein
MRTFGIEDAANNYSKHHVIRPFSYRHQCDRNDVIISNRMFITIAIHRTHGQCTGYFRITSLPRGGAHYTM